MILKYTHPLLALEVCNITIFLPQHSRNDLHLLCSLIWTNERHLSHISVWRAVVNLLLRRATRETSHRWTCIYQRRTTIHYLDQIKVKWQTTLIREDYRGKEKYQSYGSVSLHLRWRMIGKAIGPFRSQYRRNVSVQITYHETVGSDKDDPL